MTKKRSSLRIVGLESYSGPLSPLDAATVIQAARLNAIDLLETAKLLQDKGRYCHSIAFSVLALEEAGKAQLVLSLLIGDASNSKELWKAYRRHTEKSALFNFAIEMRAAVHFPKLSSEELKKIKEAGPTPEDLDAAKQLAVYSDCFSSPEGPAVHLPRNLDCKERCEQLVTEATVLVSYLRDYPPEELEVWAKYGSLAREQGRSLAEIIEPLHKELIEKGLLSSDQWAPIFEFIKQVKAKNDPEGVA